MSAGATSEPTPENDEPLLLVREGHVAHVVLNRPGKLNAIDGRMLALLAASFDAIQAEPAVRAVVVRAEGRAFCAGADLDHVGAQMASGGTFAAFLEQWHRTFSLVERCSKPTIAAVHGVALAGGLELTQVCDVVIAADDAELGDQHAQFGLFPGGGSTQRLPRLIGRRAAAWMLLSGERVSAARAAELGLVNRVVPAESLFDEAAAMADTLASRSAEANGAIKRAIREGAGLQLEDALELERSIAVPHMLGTDAQIGLDAFRSRTSPVFVGLEQDAQ
jgi:enoyl-CoA hydratase/carnithine racemase